MEPQVERGVAADPATSVAPAASPAGSGRWSEAFLAKRLVGCFERELSTGDRASLRRLTAHDPGSGAFWRVVASVLEPSGWLPSGGKERDEAETRWAVLLSVLGHTASLHADQQPLGSALAEAGWSEARLSRLLRAHDEGLLDQVALVGRYLGTKQQPFDYADLVRLVFSTQGSLAERVRRSIARSYYRRLYALAKEE